MKSEVTTCYWIWDRESYMSKKVRLPLKSAALLWKGEKKKNTLKNIITWFVRYFTEFLERSPTWDALGFAKQNHILSKHQMCRCVQGRRENKSFGFGPSLAVCQCLSLKMQRVPFPSNGASSFLISYLFHFLACGVGGSAALRKDE